MTVTDEMTDVITDLNKRFSSFTIIDKLASKGNPCAYTWSVNDRISEWQRAVDTLEMLQDHGLRLHSDFGECAEAINALVPSRESQSCSNSIQSMGT